MSRSISLSDCHDIDWVWAAGASGFDMSEYAARAELGCFSEFVDCAVEARRMAKGDVETRIHLMSSAGGLFEGQRVVNQDTEPSPVRPYGRLKLHEEQIARARFGSNDTFVYRLSSVYGRIRAGKRMGLISTLVANTLRRRETTIFGRLDTLRDYVWADDVAAYVRANIRSRGYVGRNMAILASSRPTSIFDIRSLVQKVTGTPSYIRFAGPKNAAHITFANSAIPQGFSPSMPESCVRRIISDALKTGSLWAPNVA
jgi:UDP-glucose 4-epimerase